MPRKNPLPKAELAIADRLLKTRKAGGLLRIDLARQVGVDSSRLQHYETGNAKLPATIGAATCKVLKISPIWLATGKGAANAIFSADYIKPEQFKLFSEYAAALAKAQENWERSLNEAWDHGDIVFTAAEAIAGIESLLPKLKGREEWPYLSVLSDVFELLEHLERLPEEQREFLAFKLRDEFTVSLRKDLKQLQEEPPSTAVSVGGMLRLIIDRCRDAWMADSESLTWILYVWQALAPIKGKASPGNELAKDMEAVARRHAAKQGLDTSAEAMWGFLRSINLAPSVGEKMEFQNPKSRPGKKKRPEAR